MRSFVAIALGASLGAWARWGLGVWLNPLLPSLPVGTLIANLVGGFLIGVAIGWFSQQPEIALEWRLFIVTGFLGALTTFSTFSAESVMLLQRSEIGAALFHSALHLAGSIVMTMFGFWTVRS